MVLAFKPLLNFKKKMFWFFNVNQSYIHEFAVVNLSRTIQNLLKAYFINNDIAYLECL